MDLLQKRFARFAEEKPVAPVAPPQGEGDKFERIARMRATLAALTAAERPAPKARDRVERVVSLEEEESERLFAPDGEWLSHDHVRRREKGGPETLPGLACETPHGPVHRVETFLEPRHAHGATPIAPVLHVDPQLVSMLALDPTLAGVDPRRMLYLDTETTGLMGGTGVVPFLIGLAWFEDESLRVEQLILPQLGQEAPMLRHLCERIDAASCIVTFNGKSFDWPLLRTRCVLSRVKMPEPPPHLDLLHCARRIFKARLVEGMRLTALERTVLGMFREDDVDGSEVPALYMRFLRGEHGRILLKVIEHNRLDLVAMAALLHRLEAGFRDHAADPRDQLAYARLSHRAGDRERAIRFAQAALDGDDATLVDAALLLAKLARKDRDVDREEAILVRALGRSDHGALHLALAMCLEHRRKDFARALIHAANTSEHSEGRQRRIDRLRRRVARKLSPAA